MPTDGDTAPSPPPPTKNDDTNGPNDETASTVCSKCKGLVPWVEQNPHACEANGRICTECGHFRGTRAFKGNAEETLLISYCMGRDWDKALQRVAYVPQEAFYEGYRNSTALKWAIYNNGPVNVIQAVADAYPKAASTFCDFIGCPLWVAMSAHLSERVLAIVKILVRADNDVLRTVPSEGCMESPIGNMSRVFSEVLIMAAEIPASEPMERVLAFSKENEVSEGEVDMAFRQLSMLVKADHRGLVDDDSDEWPLLFAIAGCRDPYLKSKGLLMLALRFYPEQLLQANEDGDCPLHIAVSTINRDKSDYDKDPFPGEYGHDKRLNKFLKGFCPHHWYSDFDEYVEAKCKCECDREGANFPGCSCERKEEHTDEDDEEDEDYEEQCDDCFYGYLDKEKEKCDCYAEFEKFHPDSCDCHEKFEWYNEKMTGEHRNDKKHEIEALIKACPVSAGFRDKTGSLPIHLAITSGKKWTGGIEALLTAYPAALKARDPEHRLFPFMLAAHDEKENDEDEDHDVDLTFELLRKDPTILVSVGIKATAMEPEEERKHKAARTI